MTGRILALDYGDQSIGVAISDPNQTVAFPRTVLNALPRDDFFQKLEALIQQEGVVSIVLGWPLGLQGNSTQQTEKTAFFFDELKAHLSIPIERLDERFTTFQAGLSGGDDAVAAQILLQTYLEKKIRER